MSSDQRLRLNCSVDIEKRIRDCESYFILVYKIEGLHEGIFNNIQTFRSVYACITVKSCSIEHDVSPLEKIMKVV